MKRFEAYLIQEARKYRNLRNNGFPHFQREVSVLDKIIDAYDRLKNEPDLTDEELIVLTEGLIKEKGEHVCH